MTNNPLGVSEKDLQLWLSVLGQMTGTRCEVVASGEAEGDVGCGSEARAEPASPCQWKLAAGEGEGPCPAEACCTTTPIQSNGERLGELVVLSERAAQASGPAGAGETDLSAMGQATALVTTWLRENSGFAQELLSCYEQLNAMFRIVEEVSAFEEQATAVAYAIEETSDMVPALHAFWRDRETDRVTFPAGQAELPGADRIARALAPTSEQRDNALVFTAEQPVDGMTLGDLGVGCVLIVPLVARGDRFGELYLARSRSQPEFCANDTLLMETIARAVAAVLRNIKLFERLRRVSFQVVRALVAAIDAKDHYTSGHTGRVGSYAVMLGKRVKLADQELQNLEWAAALHDVGKIGIREDVLNKPGKLTPEEFEHIKTHPVRSFRVIEPIEEMRPIRAAVKHHHEHYDGSGYPDGLMGEEIPLLARIIQIADIFDALTSTRPYRSAMSWDEAVAVLKRDSGKTTDPRLTQMFIEAIRHRQKKDARQAVPAEECL